MEPVNKVIVIFEKYIGERVPCALVKVVSTLVDAQLWVDKQTFPSKYWYEEWTVYGDRDDSYMY